MSMLYPAMNKLTQYIPNRYMMVNVVARRARQIAAEAEVTGQHLDEKPVTLAIDEVAQGQYVSDPVIEEENNEDCYGHSRQRHSASGDLCHRQGL